MKRTALIALFAVAMTGCNKEATVATPTESTTSVNASASATSPEELGRLAARIKQQPDNAKKLIADHGLTEEQFEDAIRKTAEDPEKARQYAKAFEGK
jgi:hypothetical protein